MKITIETQSYNEKRYGKPWIAIVDFSTSTKGEFIFGSWTGDHRNGGSGILTLDVNFGDIVARGQKDYRKPRNSAPDFYVVSESGELDEIGDKGSAYKYYLDNKDNGLNMENLLAERLRLEKRITEIDEILNKR